MPETIKDRNGNFHHPETGQFISVKEYVERIFEEKEKSSERDRVTLERALIEARTTTERAMQEAKATVEKAQGEAATSIQTRLLEAKEAADEREEQVQKRLSNLESGGAPFASRLDSNLNAMQDDVDVLKVNMVKTTVLDALRVQTEERAEAQRKQIKYIFIAAAISLGISLIQVLGKVSP